MQDNQMFIVTILALRDNTRRGPIPKSGSWGWEFSCLKQPMDDMTMRNWFDERRISPMDGRAKESRFIAVRSSQDTPSADM